MGFTVLSDVIEFLAQAPRGYNKIHVQLSMKYTRLINVKMSTNVGISTLAG